MPALTLLVIAAATAGSLTLNSGVKQVTLLELYTPGLFTNGREWRGWMLRLNPRASDREPGNLAVEVAGGKLQAAFPIGAVPLELHLALPGSGLETLIERGENRNHTLAQEFVVLRHEKYM